jgi:alpha-L-fucosidase
MVDDLMERLQPDMVIVGPADGGKKMMRNRGIACKESSSANPDRSNVRGQKRDTSYWFPEEACTIMTGGWFWQSPNTRRESLKTTLDIYYNTVGRGANLLLNVAADRRGKIDDASVKQLQEWRAALDQTFKVNLAAGMTATASNIRGGDKAFGPSQALDGNRETYWCTDDGVTNATMEVDLGGPCEFDVVLVQEYIALGQRVEKWRVESLSEATWTTVAGGATIGQKRLERIKPVTATKVRLVIEKSAACPTIHAFGLYKQANPPAR